MKRKKKSEKKGKKNRNEDRIFWPTITTLGKDTTLSPKRVLCLFSALLICLLHTLTTFVLPVLLPSFVCCTLRLIKSGLEGHAGLKNTCCIIKTLRSLTRALEYKMNASQPCDTYAHSQSPTKARERERA